MPVAYMYPQKVVNGWVSIMRREFQTQLLIFILIINLTQEAVHSLFPWSNIFNATAAFDFFFCFF